MAKLRVELEKANTVTYQVPKRSRYQTPGKLKAATKEKMRGGSIRLVAYEANQWISQLFVKSKGKIGGNKGKNEGWVYKVGGL